LSFIYRSVRVCRYYHLVLAVSYSYPVIALDYPVRPFYLPALVIRHVRFYYFPSGALPDLMRLQELKDFIRLLFQPFQLFLFSLFFFSRPVIFLVLFDYFSAYLFYLVIFFF